MTDATEKLSTDERTILKLALRAYAERARPLATSPCDRINKHFADHADIAERLLEKLRDSREVTLTSWD